MKKQSDPESVVREIRRKTRRKFSSEEKIRIVLEGLRGEESIAELCRREGINPNLYYKWSKEFLEAFCGPQCQDYFLSDLRWERRTCFLRDSLFMLPS